MKKLILAFISIFATCAMHAHVTEITSNNQFNQIINANKPSVVKFGAPWCGACTAAKPSFKAISNKPEFKDVAFAEIDTDQVSGPAEKYNVRGLPTFIIFEKGKDIDRIVGMNDITSFTQFLSKRLAKDLTLAEAPIASAQSQEPANAVEEIMILEEVAPAKTASAATTEGQSIADMISGYINQFTNWLGSLFKR